LKNNWLIVGVILLFIVVYERFVVSPYKDSIIKQNNVEAINKSPSLKGKTTISSNAIDEVVEEKKVILKQKTWSGFIDRRLSEKRSLKLSDGGKIGEAILWDYEDKNKKEHKPVKIVPNYFVWSSTDSAVDNCLKSLIPKEQGEVVEFNGQVSEGSCQLKYSFRADNPGLVNTKLNLDGFARSEGFVSLSTSDDLGPENRFEQKQLAYRLDDSVERESGSDLQVNKVEKGKIDWISWGDKYFASLLVSKGNYVPSLILKKENNKAEEENVNFAARYPLLGQKSTQYELDLFFGTRDIDLYNKISPTVEEAIDFGWFPTITKLFVSLLKKIYQYTQNYGWAIILLTIFVRIIFWPLNKKAFASGLKMKAVQPQMDALRKKYGKDREQALQMNKEVFALYKKHKINPMGSCLPILLQMPILFGLYSALNFSMDLYQAPFLGWITDLSSPDPYFVFPALWTVTLFGVSLINPQGAGPSQPGMPNMKYMMFGMNFLFGFLSKDWPAGLTIYLFVSSFVGLAQQFFMKKSAKFEIAQEGV